MIPRRAVKIKFFSVCGHLCGQRRFCAAFCNRGKSRKCRRRKALRRFTLPRPGYRHGTPKPPALPAAPHPVIFIFSLFPAYWLSAIRPRRFPQKHSRGSSLGSLAPLPVSSPRSNAFIRPRRRHSSSPNCATPGYIYFLVSFLLIGFPLSVRGASLRNIVA